MIQVEKDFWLFSKQHQFFDYINPTNVEWCKASFLRAIENGVDYNPVFEYRDIDFSVSQVIASLQSFRNHFEKHQSYESQLYCKAIDFDIDWIENISRRNSVKFTNWLSNLYAKPSKYNLNLAIETIRELNPSPLKEILKPSAAQERMDTELQKRDYCNWTTMISWDITAKIYVDSIHNKIVINGNKLFSHQELDRLIVHEIDTHVLRHENGKKQNSLIYAYGFPDYIETEEGLALFAEYKTNLLSDLDLSKYCARLIASYYTYELSFCDLFWLLCEYVPQEIAVDIVIRVKRGLHDSASKGGFTKDQVYFSGFNLIRGLDIDKLRLLYVGKVGVADLDRIPGISDKLTLNSDIPLWIEELYQV